MKDNFDRHIALVYLAQARAFDGEFRSTLVRWSRKKWRLYIRALKQDKAQGDLFQ